MPLTSDIVSVVALLVSCLALFITWRFNAQQLKLMTNQDALAKRQLEAGAAQDSLSKQANLNAELVKLDERRCSSKRKVQLRLQWDDEAGSDHEKIVPVSF